MPQVGNESFLPVSGLHEEAMSDLYFLGKTKVYVLWQSLHTASSVASLLRKGLVLISWALLPTPAAPVIRGWVLVTPCSLSEQKGSIRLGNEFSCPTQKSDPSPFCCGLPVSKGNLCPLDLLLHPRGPCLSCCEQAPNPHQAHLLGACPRGHRDVILGGMGIIGGALFPPVQAESGRDRTGQNVQSATQAGFVLLFTLPLPPCPHQKTQAFPCPLEAPP